MAGAMKNIEIGYEVSPVVLEMTQEKMNLFSNRTIPRGNPQGVSGPNIHTDNEIARRVGLPGTVAEGLQVFASISKLMTNLFSEGWLKGGKLSVSFINIMSPGDTLTIKGVVKDKTTEGSATRVTLDVWCENQNGDKTIVGVASGLVS